MRFARIAVLAALLALVALPSASALDIEQDIQPTDAVVGVPYSFQLVGEEGCEDEYTFTLILGSLPPGLTLQKDGKIVGTPTQAGLFEFYVELTDDCEPAFRNSVPSQGKFRIIVAPALVVTTASLAPAKVGAPYSKTLESQGGGSVAWSVTGGTLPPGLALNGNTGVLSGTPTTVGSFAFTVQAFSPGPARTGTKQLTLVVAAPLSASPPAARTGEVGVPFSAAATTSGGAGPFAWSVAKGSLPAGLALDAASGAIKGTPGVSGAFTVTLGVSDAAGYSASVDVALTIVGRLAVATKQLASAEVGHFYRAKLASSGGQGPVKWSLASGKLPAGVFLDAKRGVLTGKPRKPGTYRFTVRATDSLGGKTTRTLVLVVKE
jgi:putative Ig domain-containing protein